MRMDNLRAAPAWVTPLLVGRVLELAGRPDVGGAQNDTNATPATARNDTNATPARQPSRRGGGPRPGHGRNGKYQNWTPEEDAALRQAYASGARIDLLSIELGRPYKGTVSRAVKLGLSHPRDIKGGFITSPKWTPPEDELLRELYGNIPTPELPARIGRSKSAIFNRAFQLGLRHGYQRCWTRPELAALRIAYQRGIAIADVAAALGRKAFSVSKYASNHGMLFGARPLVLEPLTLQDILALDDPLVLLPPRADPWHGRSRAEHQQLIRQSSKRERTQMQEAARRERAEAREIEQRRKRQQREAERDRREQQKRIARLAAARERERERATAAMERARAAEERRHGTDRVAIDRTNKRRSNATRRRQIEEAEEFVDSGKVITRATPVYLKIAQRAVIQQREEAARLADPIEQAKVVLQRRGRVVHSMAVWGGRDDRFFVTGLGRDVTAEQLLEAAERLAA
jgi:hypothetical protein